MLFFILYWQDYIYRVQKENVHSLCFFSGHYFSFHFMVIMENNLLPKRRLLTNGPLSTSNAAGTPQALSWRLASVCFFGEVEVEGKLFQSWSHLETGSACCHFLTVVGPPPGGQFSGEEGAVRWTAGAKHPGLGELMGKGTWGPISSRCASFPLQTNGCVPPGSEERKVH